MSQRGGGVGFCCGVPERVTCDYPGGVTGQEQRGWDESGLAGGAGTTGRAREKGRSGRRGTWALSGPAGLARWGPRGLGRPASFSRPSPQRKKSRGWGQGGEQPVGWEVDGGRKTGVGDPQDYTGGSSLLWSPPTLSLGTEIPQETLGFRSQVYPEQGLGSGSSSPSVA